MKKTLRKAGIIATAAVTGLAPLAAPVVTFAAEDTKKPDTLAEAQKELDAAKKAEADAKKAYENQKAVAEAKQAAWAEVAEKYVAPVSDAYVAAMNVLMKAETARDAADAVVNEKADAVVECRTVADAAWDALEAAREEAADAKEKIEAAEKKVAEAQSKYDAAKEEAEKAVKIAEERKAQYEEAQKAFDEAEAVMKKAKANVEAAEAGKDFTDLSGHTHHFEEKEVLVEEEKYETVTICTSCGKTVAEVLTDAKAEFEVANDEYYHAMSEVEWLTNSSGELKRIAEEAVKAEKEALDALNAAKAELEEVKPADLAEAEKAYEEAKDNFVKAVAELDDADEAREKAYIAYEKAEEDFTIKADANREIGEKYGSFYDEALKAYRELEPLEDAYKEAKARLVLAQTNYDELKKAEAGKEDGKGNGSKDESKNETSDTVKTGDAAPLAGLLGTMLASGSAVVTLGKKKRK